MADLTRLSRLLNGIQRGVQISSNTLVVDNLKIKMGSGNDGFHATFAGTLTSARTITMPDANVDLGDISLNSAKRHDAMTLNAGQTTQDAANLAGQELELNPASGTTAGVMSAADKSKLDGIEAGAKDDQVASEVPVTAQNGVAATDVQAALEEIDAEAVAAQAAADAAQADIDAHLDGGASKHDASEIDVEAADGLNHSAADLETVIGEIDDAIGSLAQGSDYTAASVGVVASHLAAIDSSLASKIPLAQKGAANGVASLDGSGKVPVSQLPSAIMEYQGTYDASANSPALADGAGNSDEAVGNVYRVTVAGSQDFGSGSISFEVGDYVILNASKVWEKSDTTDAVASVNGYQGVVVLDTDDISEGATNLYYTQARFDSAFAAKSTSDLSEGTNLYFTDARAIAAPLTGFTSGAGALAASDSILEAIQKLDGNIAALDSSADFSHTQADTNDWTVADGGTIAAHLDELADRTAAVEAWDSGDLDHTQADAADWTVASGATVAAHLDEVGDRLKNLEDTGANTENLSEDLVAGETLTSGIRALRWAKGAETAGRVYLADKDASSQDDFHVMGLVVATGEAAGAAIDDVIKAGPLVASSHGFSIGEPLFLDASGAITQTAPSSADEAIVKVGMVRDANTIEVQIQIMGVN